MKCCGCRRSPWGYVRVTQSKDRDRARGLRAGTEMGSHKDAPEAGWGDGWESTLRSSRAGGSYGARCHRQAGLRESRGTRSRQDPAAPEGQGSWWRQ